VSLPPPLRVKTAENKRWYTSQYDRPHAHRAWLQRYIESRIKKPPGAQFPRGFSYGDYFGMACRVQVRFAQITSSGDDSAIVDNYCADRHFSFGLSLHSFSDGKAHPLFMAAPCCWFMIGEGWGNRNRSFPVKIFLKMYYQRSRCSVNPEHWSLKVAE